MAKKQKMPSTPEMRAEKLQRKQEKRKIFRGTFAKAFGAFLASVLTFSLIVVAFKPAPTTQTIVASGGNQNIQKSNMSNQNNQGSSNSGGKTETTNSNSDSSKKTGGDNSSENNSTASVIEEFNKAINKVKTDGKITRLRNGSKPNGNSEGKFPFPITTSVVDKVIDTAMASNGIKEENASVSADDFPVEKQSYSSKLTADDVKSAKKDGNVITLELVDDELGEADNGHGQKALSVIKSSTIMDNVPGIAKSIVSEAKTSCKNAKIVATLDDKGNVIKASYTFDWDIALSGSGLDCKLHFAQVSDFEISY